MSEDTATETREADSAPASPGMDQDLARLIELVERMGGHGEQPL